MACIAPEDPGIARVLRLTSWNADLDTTASLARMAVCLDPADSTLPSERIHRSAKAKRPDLLPPHWIRDVLAEAQALQSVIQTSGLEAARSFIANPELAGHRTYLPRFHALKHFVRFNTEPGYRAVFLRNCLSAIALLPERAPAGTPDANGIILKDLAGIAKWVDRTDTIVPGKSLPIYAGTVEKRMLAGKLRNATFTDVLRKWRQAIVDHSVEFWRRQHKASLVGSLYGRWSDRLEDCDAGITFHINKILSGPVIGPHYHSAHRYDEQEFPMISGVYYPETIQQDDATKAGYLEFGRPDFPVPFEPVRVTFRPVAGTLILFPAFAYHGVIPIKQGPRYSVNLDVYLKPQQSNSWCTADLFD